MRPFRYGIVVTAIIFAGILSLCSCQSENIFAESDRPVQKKAQTPPPATDKTVAMTPAEKTKPVINPAKEQPAEAIPAEPEPTPKIERYPLKEQSEPVSTKPPVQKPVVKTAKPVETPKKVKQPDQPALQRKKDPEQTKTASVETATIAPQTNEKDAIVLQLQWYPQAQFAGYIMAQEKGIFKKHGLDVQLVWPGFGTTPMTNLDERKTDFCTAWLSEAIVNRRNGKNICLIAQVLPKSSMMIVAKKKTGITRPKDLNGMKVGLWSGDFKIAPTAFFKKYGIEPVCITQTSSVLPFLRDAVSAASAMYYNEYHKFLEAGMNEDELVTFKLADYGLDMPEDGLYCRSDYRKLNPEICDKMAQAVREGWQYSFDNEMETVQTIVQYCTEQKTHTNKNHQLWMLRAMKAEQLTDKPWGYLDKKVYNNLVNMLIEQKIIDMAPDYTDIYQPALTNDKTETGR